MEDKVFTHFGGYWPLSQSVLNGFSFFTICPYSRIEIFLTSKMLNSNTHFPPMQLNQTIFWWDSLSKFLAIEQIRLIRFKVNKSTMSSAPPAKRHRVEISGSVKHKICQHKLSYPKCTISGLIIYAQKELNIDIGKSTISDILKHREKWLNI